MKIIFMGTPEFAAYSLEMLAKYHEVALVVTQPDKPSGRGYKLTPPPVKVVAQKQGLTVIQPEKVKAPEIINQLREVAPEAIVVVAFGQKIPPEILEMPPLGCINLHGSLLPRYRGAAPIQRAIMNGDNITGLTTQLMAEGWDTGDMLLKCEVPIDINDTAGTLHDKMMHSGAKLLVETLIELEMGKIVPMKQNHAEATYASKMTKEDRVVDWNKPAREVYDHLRALLPWPGIKFMHKEKEISLFDLSLGSEEIKGQLPGTVIAVTPDWFEVACTDNSIRFGSIKPEGRRQMSVQEYINGYSLFTGDILESIKVE